MHGFWLLIGCRITPPENSVDYDCGLYPRPYRDHGPKEHLWWPNILCGKWTSNLYFFYDSPRTEKECMSTFFYLQTTYQQHFGASDAVLLQTRYLPFSGSATVSTAFVLFGVTTLKKKTGYNMHQAVGGLFNGVSLLQRPSTTSSCLPVLYCCSDKGVPLGGGTIIIATATVLV